MKHVQASILWCDNIEIDVHSVHARVIQYQLEVQYDPSTYQIVDILTKVLPTTRLLYLRSKLN